MNPRFRRLLVRTLQSPKLSPTYRECIVDWLSGAFETMSLEEYSSRYPAPLFSETLNSIVSDMGWAYIDGQGFNIIRTDNWGYRCNELRKELGLKPAKPTMNPYK